MIRGGWMAQAIYVAARLGIADALAAGPKPNAAVASAVGADPAALHRLLRGLTALGLLRECPDGAFELTPLGGHLRAGVPGSLRATALFWGGALWPLWGALLHGVKTGRSLRAAVSGKGTFEGLAQKSDAARVFNDAMVEMTTLIAADVARAVDFSGVRRIVDVGGGYGGLLLVILRAHPGLRGILFDLPYAVEDAARQVAEAGLAERCEVVGGSFFESVPGGVDACLLKGILHDWDDERCAEILTNCRRALGDAGRLIVVERLLPARMEPAAEHRSTAASDLNMLVAVGGRERTAEEYRELLAAAGFTMTRTTPLPAYFHVVEARC
jgi:hypothetical protein